MFHLLHSFRVYFSRTFKPLLFEDIEKFFSNQDSLSFLNPEKLQKLLKNLQKHNLLPSILFNFDRSLITRILTNLVTFLRNEQHKKYYGTEQVIIELHSKRVEKMWNCTRNEWRRLKSTIETSGEDVLACVRNKNEK
jgi:hypothetical protein